MSNTVKLNENNFSKLDDFIEEYIEKKAMGYYQCRS